MAKKALCDIYDALLVHFGRQQWWPMEHGFRPREWEICTGAILTQNTSWANVEKALANLRAAAVISPSDVLSAARLEMLIRPAGFFRQKAERLRRFSRFVLSFNNFVDFKKTVTRDQILGITGIGPETADSILLYACGRPTFVVDAYTKRIFSRIGLIEPDWSYSQIKQFFEHHLPPDAEFYKEYHALIVELGKTICRKKPLCSQCPLEHQCEKRI